MKTSLKIIACMAALGVLLTVQSAAAQGKLPGVWKIAEITISGPNPQTIPATSPNLIIFTKKHFSLVSITGESRPNLPQKDATDAQKVATWTPFAAVSGTYTVKGTTFTAQALVAKDPSGMAPGNFVTYDFKIVGNTLIATPKASQDGPITNPPIVKLTRLE